MENMENKNKEQETSGVNECCKNEKKQITNEMLYEAMQHMMVGQACMLTTQMTVFNIILEHRNELKLTNVESKILEHGIEALRCTIDGLEEKSGMNEKIAEAIGVKVVEVSSPQELMDILSQIMR